MGGGSVRIYLGPKVYKKSGVCINNTNAAKYLMRIDREISNRNKKFQPDISNLSLPRERVVPEVGIEPTRGCPRRILNPVRLPISPLRHFKFAIEFDPKYSIPLIKLAKISTTGSIFLSFFILKSFKRSKKSVQVFIG